MKRFESWGRYPSHPQSAVDCHWRSEVPDRLAQAMAEHGSTLPWGNGRSYGDSCLATSDCVLRLKPLDRIISVDWTRGIVRAEAGITLGALLAVTVPQGWFLPVVPGTRFATLGGAVANDVHGKNHHRNGTFGRHVLNLGMVRSDRGRFECSLMSDPALFTATIGGLGLTGVIEWVEIHLQPVSSARLQVRTARFDTLGDFFALADDWDPRHEYSVAWLDCLHPRGRGAYSAANHVDDGDYRVPTRHERSFPVTPPVSLINHASLRAFNAAYWRLHPAMPSTRIRLFEPFFFPLDRILHWNRLYGRRGFQQYQCVLPEAVASDVLPELLSLIRGSGRGSFLAVLKRCGEPQSPGLLSFPLPGTSLALDFPQHADLDDRLFPHLDALVHECGGRLYPAKDAHMQGAHFRQAYPDWERVEALRDPALNSRFWQRVTS